MHRDSSEVVIGILDDLLVIKCSVYERNSEILIFDWKLGMLLNKILCGHPCAFGFLNPDTLFVFNFSDENDVPATSLLIYENIRRRTDPWQDDPIGYGPSQYTSMTPHFQLDFPEFPPGSYAQFSMRSELASMTTAYGSAVFVPLPTARIIEVSMLVGHYNRRDAEFSCYGICLSKQKLLHLISLEHSPEPGQSLIKIPWEAWGERTTRWFENTGTGGYWISRAYGTRFLRIMGFDESSPLEHISVLDFHPVTTRRFCSPHLSMWGSAEARRHLDANTTDEDFDRAESSFQSRQDALAEDENAVFVDTIDEDVPTITPFNGKSIITRLPYRIVTRVRSETHRLGWMIDNNCIIGLPVSAYFDRASWCSPF